MDNLPARLRDLAKDLRQGQYRQGLIDVQEEAAFALDAQAREIARLREALQSIGQYCDDTIPLPLNYHRITTMIRNALSGLEEGCDHNFPQRDHTCVGCGQEPPQGSEEENSKGGQDENR